MTETVFNLGRTVLCDTCNEDYTDSQESGGFVFGGHAYCPKCAERSLPNIIRYGEEHYIKARCPEGVPFSDFVREYRGEDGGTIRIITMD